MDGIPSDVQFTGSFVVPDNDDDFVGIVFGYKSASDFYIILGSGRSTNNNHTDSWRILKVNSETG